MEVEAEVFRKFAALEDVIEQPFVAWAKQNGVVSHVIVGDVRPEVEDEQRHRPVHLFQLSGTLLSGGRRGVESVVGVMHVGV